LPIMLDHIIYLSEEDVARASIPLDRLREVVADAFAARARGTAQAAPKSVLPLGPGHVFQAKPAVLRESGFAGVKWFGLVPRAQTSGPTICSLIVLSDATSGVPLAVMGGNWITAARTGAMTAIAAQSLARADSASIGFVAPSVAKAQPGYRLQPHRGQRREICRGSIRARDEGKYNAPTEGGCRRNGCGHYDRA
jgi:alanine dehydrogenase